MDLRFREQFAIPHPTDTYAAIIETVPEIYVGPVSRIIPIVQVMPTLRYAGQGRMGRDADPYILLGQGL